jgi:hypothetical protein
MKRNEGRSDWRPKTFPGTGTLIKRSAGVGCWWVVGGLLVGCWWVGGPKKKRDCFKGAFADALLLLLLAFQNDVRFQIQIHDGIKVTTKGF